MVAGDAVGFPGEGQSFFLLPPRQAQERERGEEDLSEVCRHQVVQDGVDGRADVEEDVGQHVEVVVEVVEETGRTDERQKSECGKMKEFKVTRVKKASKLSLLCALCCQLPLDKCRSNSFAELLPPLLSVQNSFMPWDWMGYLPHILILPLKIDSLETEKPLGDLLPCHAYT